MGNSTRLMSSTSDCKLFIFNYNAKMASIDCTESEKQTFFSKIANSLAKKSLLSVNSLHCVEWLGCADKYGYGTKRVTWPDKTVSLERVHRLSYMLYKSLLRHEVPHHNGNAVLEVSHLCHNKLCIKPEHLVLESHETNCERKACFMLGTCCRVHFPECKLRPLPAIDRVETAGR